MDDADVNRLVELLDQLKREELRSPSLPRPVWRALAGLVPQVAVEVLLTRDGHDLLLVFRDDEDWQGWHIPGGWMACGESVDQAADRVALRELGIHVRVKQVLDAYAWPDHPYAHAVSILCVCERAERLVVPGVGTFFLQLPDSMVAHHRDFAGRFLRAQGEA